MLDSLNNPSTSELLILLHHCQVLGIEIGIVDAWYTRDALLTHTFYSVLFDHNFELQKNWLTHLIIPGIILLTKNTFIVLLAFLYRWKTNSFR